MTPDERAPLQRAGRVLLYSLQNTTTVTVFYGMALCSDNLAGASWMMRDCWPGAFMLLVALSTYTLLNRGLKARATQVMLITTLAGFLFATAHWISFVAFYVIQIRGVFLESGGVLTRATFQAINARGALIRAVIENWELHLVTILSDGIVIWRTWVLFPDQPWARLVPCALFVGTVCSALAYQVIDLVVPSIASDAVAERLSNIDVQLYGASIGLSLASNAVSTLLIFYRLWGHLRYSRKVGLRRMSTSPVSRVMLILVESGVVYCAIQVANLLLFLLPADPYSPRDVANNSLGQSATAVTAMYPAIIVVLVTRQRSMVETFGFTTELRNNGAADPEAASSRLERSDAKGLASDTTALEAATGGGDVTASGATEQA
ncbi:hypothetical protein LshimejAT787_0212670 [Lyophyllum shimeji]|uniref:Uncharacterized protein n=1 Tax=Lyophyllum shimeji TaxID=47721 RepID=A0A9P3PHX2_LYOSH|nr:hypothetical protein LshimejAT787_0212670 [Lyophyllum shimeji]